jgi:hypothetical protein
VSKVERDCLRALRTSAAFALAASVRKSRPWASALFVGHRLTIEVESGDAAQFDVWLAALPEAELSWPGHVVASAEVIGRSANIGNIELLVVEA